MSQHGSKNPPSGNSQNVTLSQDGRPGLRRPMPDTQQRLLNGSPGTGNQQVSPKKQTVQLSVNAPEFVPKFSIPPPNVALPQPQAGQGDGLMKPNLSVTAAEFVPRGQPAYTHVQNNLFEDFQRLVSITPSHVSAPASKPSSDKVINGLKSMLFNMTIQPGNIEEYLSSIVNIMKNVTDETVVREVIEILFEQVDNPDGTSEKIGVLRFVLRDLLLALLSNPNDTTVKSVTQLIVHFE